MPRSSFIFVVLALGANAAPPTLNFEFQANLTRHGFEAGPSQILSVSEKQNIIAVEMPATMPFMKKQTNIVCNDPTVNHGVNSMQIYPFFNETVCENVAMNGAPPGSTQKDCFKHSLGEFMLENDSVEWKEAVKIGQTTFDGTAVDIWSWTSPMETSHSSEWDPKDPSKYQNFTNYINSTVLIYVEPKQMTLRKLNLTEKQRLTCLPCSTRPCQPSQNRTIMSASVSTFTNFVSPAPPASLAPPEGVKCVDISPGESRLLGGPAWDDHLGPDGQPAWAGGMATKTVNDPELLQRLEAEAKAGNLTWTPGYSKFMAGKTMLEVKQQLLGTQLGSPLSLPASPHAEYLKAQLRSEDIPTAFDARSAWSQCASIGAIRNQGHCGSCWAFAAVESLLDRMCIANSKLLGNTRAAAAAAAPLLAGAAEYAAPLPAALSAQSLVDCDKHDGGCKGGFLDNAWEFLLSTGAMSDQCAPYKHCKYTHFANCTPPTLSTRPRDSNNAPPPRDQCLQTCADNSTMKHYKAASAYAVRAPGE
jgi:hypothetical protein